MANCASQLSPATIHADKLGENRLGQLYSLLISVIFYPLDRAVLQLQCLTWTLDSIDINSNMTSKSKTSILFPEVLSNKNETKVTVFR